MKKNLLVMFILLISGISLFAENLPTIAIAGFNSTVASQEDINELIDELSSQMKQAEGYRFVDLSERELLREFSGSISLVENVDKMSELGKHLAAEYVVVGSIELFNRSQLFNKKLLFHARTVKVETGVTVASYSRKFDSIEQIITASDGIVTHLLGRTERKLPRIAVLDFHPSNMTAAEAESFTDFIISSISDLEEYTVIDRKNRDILLEEMEFSLSGLGDEESSLEVGRLLAASYLVDGSVGNIENKRFFLNMRLIDIESAEIVSMVSEIYISLDDLLLDSYRILHKFAGIEAEWSGGDITETPVYQLMMHENWYDDIWCYGVNFTPSYRLDFLLDSNLHTADIGGGVSLLLGNKLLFLFDFSYQIPVLLYEDTDRSVPVLLSGGIPAYDSCTVYTLSAGLGHRIKLSEHSAFLYGAEANVSFFLFFENPGGFDNISADSLVDISFGPVLKAAYIIDFDDMFFLQFGLRARYNWGIYADTWKEGRVTEFKDVSNFSISPEIAFYMNQRKM